MKIVQVRFRKTVFDITHDDGIIDTIVYNGQEVQGLMFDMGFLGDLTTVLSWRQSHPMRWMLLNTQLNLQEKSNTNQHNPYN
jgi:hypothetical protein